MMSAHERAHEGGSTGCPDDPFKPCMLLQPVDDLAPIDQHLEKEHQEKTKVKNIQACSCSNLGTTISPGSNQLGLH